MILNNFIHLILNLINDTQTKVVNNLKKMIEFEFTIYSNLQLCNSYSGTDLVNL